MELLKDMALFVEVVKAKGFRAAAQVLNMPNSTVSRRIGALEKAIGLRLLQRTTRKVELTEAGQIYFERCKRIVDEARIAHEELDGMLAQPSGVLRASLPVDFAATYMASLIAEFAARYPDLIFDFDLTPRQVNLASEPFDVAIRIGEPQQPHLIARRLASWPPCLYASPAYLLRHGEPAAPDGLAGHQCLSMPGNGSWTLDDGVTTVQVAVGSRFTINNAGLIRRLATLDQGIVMMPHAIVADDLAAGRLRRILTHWHGKPVPIYAVTETRLLPAKTQRFIEFVRERLSDGPWFAEPGE
ncbi:LysR family transcriptional regulator [Massilia sp. 9096]|uniref:LysR family transcriptional regulator n=1 Tax=Massilia sp. 9096 TaxID=1500894 RepID=UPI00055CC557|nr:LysR family transcriptional regulator [Massilia sp. 9096]